MLVREGDGHNPIVYVTFTSAKEMKLKYILTSLKNNNFFFCFYFKVV
jgi:hypothetical protein